MLRGRTASTVSDEDLETFGIQPLPLHYVRAVIPQMTSLHLSASEEQSPEGVPNQQTLRPLRVLEEEARRLEQRQDEILRANIKHRARDWHQVICQGC